MREGEEMDERRGSKDASGDFGCNLIEVMSLHQWHRRSPGF